ncbi:MAG: hypothetical protein R3F62_12495 [Planctomycetota bacterium]
MDQAYQEALRAWQIAPREPGALARLIRAAARGGEALPDELDHERVFEELAERAQDAYGTLDAGGYRHVVGWTGWSAAEVPDLEELQERIDGMADPDTSLGPTLPSGCLDVRSLTPVKTILRAGPFDGKEFLGLELAAGKALSAFPGARCFDLQTRYPSTVVFYSSSQLAWLPIFDMAYLVIVQEVW